MVLVSDSGECKRRCVRASMGACVQAWVHACKRACMHACMLAWAGGGNAFYSLIGFLLQTFQTHSLSLDFDNGGGPDFVCVING